MIDRMFGKDFKRTYLEKEKHFLQILFHFLNLYEILSLWKKKASYMA